MACEPAPLNEKCPKFFHFLSSYPEPRSLEFDRWFILYQSSQTFQPKVSVRATEIFTSPLGLKKDASPNLSSKPFFFTLVLLFIPEASCYMS